MAPHSSTLAWKVPWVEEPGRLQSMGSLWVGYDWATSLSLFTFMHWRRNGNPLQCSCLENPRDGGAWWAAVCGVAQIGHDWSDLAVAVVYFFIKFGAFFSHYFFKYFFWASPLLLSPWGSSDTSLRSLDIIPQVPRLSSFVVNLFFFLSLILDNFYWSPSSLTLLSSLPS